MNEFLVFYSEPGFPFWRVLRTWSPFSPAQVARDFLTDYSQLVVPAGLADETPRFVMVRGFHLN